MRVVAALLALEDDAVAFIGFTVYWYETLIAILSLNESAVYIEIPSLQPANLSIARKNFG
jgi:hypothetical protein